MASVRLNGDTSGFIEISAPNVAGSTTITLPATSGGNFLVTDSNGDLNVDSNTLFVDASENRVGIGIASPDNKLHVFAGDSSGSSSAQTQLTIENSGNSGLQFLAGTSSVSQIRFGDSGDNGAGSILYNHTDNAIVFGTNNGVEDMRIDSGGRLLIATNSSVSSNALFSIRTGAGGSGCIAEIRHAGNSGANRDFIRFFNIDDVEAGSIEHDGSTSVAFRTSSDYRLKENIVPLTGALQRLHLLKPSRFNFISEPERVVDGFIAHEAQEVVPESVGGEKDAVDEDGKPIYQGIDQSKMVPLLTAALQEASCKIEALETANASLEARLTALEGGN